MQITFQGEQCLKCKTFIIDVSDIISKNLKFVSVFVQLSKQKKHFYGRKLLKVISPSYNELLIVRKEDA
jgi:hypothetical protein